MTVHSQDELNKTIRGLKKKRSANPADRRIPQKVSARSTLASCNRYRFPNSGAFPISNTQDLIVTIDEIRYLSKSAHDLEIELSFWVYQLYLSNTREVYPNGCKWSAFSFRDSTAQVPSSSVAPGSAVIRAVSAAAVVHLLWRPPGGRGNLRRRLLTSRRCGCGRCRLR